MLKNSLMYKVTNFKFVYIGSNPIFSISMYLLQLIRFLKIIFIFFFLFILYNRFIFFNFEIFILVLIILLFIMIFIIFYYKIDNENFNDCNYRINACLIIYEETFQKLLKIYLRNNFWNVSRLYILVEFICRYINMRLNLIVFKLFKKLYVTIHK